MAVSCPFTGIPPVQSSTATFSNPGGSYNYDVIVSFCKKMTVEDLFKASSTTASFQKTLTNCESGNKLPSGDSTQILGMINNPASDDCDTVLTEYGESPYPSSTLTQPWLQQKTPSSAGVKFDFTCDETATTWSVDTSKSMKGTSTNPSYIVVAKWAGACPGHDFGGGGGSSSSGGGAFGVAIIIILLVGIVLYIVGMVGYNKFVKKAEGRDIAPHPDFWTAVPGYLKDGHMFVINKVKGGGANSEYSSV